MSENHVAGKRLHVDVASGSCPEVPFGEVEHPEGPASA
jgi:hypothetical protein